MYLERKRTVRERLQGIPTMQIACSGDRDGSGRSILSNHELASTVRLEIALTFKQGRIVFRTHCQALCEYAIVNHPIGGLRAAVNFLVVQFMQRFIRLISLHKLTFASHNSSILEKK
jgi:hypothetical protein